MKPLMLVPKNDGFVKTYRARALELAKPYTPLVEEENSFRVEDIPKCMLEFFHKGELAYGLTDEHFYEQFCLNQPEECRNVRRIATLPWDDPAAMFRKPALCLIQRSGAEDIDSVAINGKYATLAKRYLSEIDAICRVESYWGGTEKLVELGLSDAAIDIVYTGRTIRDSGLEIRDVISKADVVLISPVWKP